MRDDGRPRLRCDPESAEARTRDQVPPRDAAAARRGKDKRTLRGGEEADGGQIERGDRGKSHDHGTLHCTVTRANFRLPTLSRYVPGDSFAFGSPARSPSTVTPPWAMSRRASEPDEARPIWAIVFTSRTPSAP